MNILAAAADQMSWAKLMGIPANTFLETTFAALFNGNEYILTQNKADVYRPTVALSSSPSTVFTKLCVSYRAVINGSEVSDNVGSPVESREYLLVIKNSAGYKILSVGYEPYSIGFNFTAGLHLYTWSGTSANTLVQKYQLGGFGLVEVADSRGAFTNNSQTPLSIFVHYDLDTPANSVIRVVSSAGIKVLELLGVACNSSANLTMANMYIGCVWNSTPLGNYYNVMHLSYLVVADTEDYTLKATTLKPNAFGATNEFTGAIANIQAWLQDTRYLTSPNEVDTTTIINLTPKAVSNGNLHNELLQTINSIAAIDLYFMGRYIQTGGVSITFRLNLMVNGADATATKDVVIPANEDDTKYCGRYISKAITNLISTAHFTATDLTTLAVKIKLVGV